MSWHSWYKSNGALDGSCIDANCYQYVFERGNHIPNDTERDANRKNIALTLAYDGTHYFGFQKTKEGPSIEESIEQALAKLLGKAIEITAASRTDRGVHAEGQTVNFFLEEEIALEKLQYRLNAVLPKEIRVTDTIAVPDTFHSTLSALKKEYHYFIETGEIQNPFNRHTTWHYPYKLNINEMRKAAALLIGKKDFITFQNSGRKAATTVREIETISIEGDNFLHFTLIGNSFLYKMVRNIVGTLVYIGEGKLQLSDLETILASGERKNAGICAPAHGLTLKRVIYHDFTK